PFTEHAAAEFGMGVPELARHAETIHRQEHLLDFRPVPLQRHRIAPRGPAVAEADHGPDIGEAERRVDHRQREQHILAGVHGENVLLSLPVIDTALGLANVRTVICLGNSWTARRYAMTLQRHWPEVEKMLLTVDSFGVPRQLWHTHPEFRRRVLSEW